MQTQSQHRLLASRLGQYVVMVFMSVVGVLGIPVLGIALCILIRDVTHVGILVAIGYVVWISAWITWGLGIWYIWAKLWDHFMDFEY